MSEAMDRRKFLKTNMAAGLGMALSARAPFLLGSDEAKAIGIGVIGMGGRGSGLMRTLLRMKGVAIRAVCDIVPTKVANAQKIVVSAGQDKPAAYSDGDMTWTQLCDRDDLDAVIIATPWEWHTRMAVGAMKAGKYAGVEVPCSITTQECWDLVDTSEKTGLPCMMLENWSFRSDNLAVLNMIRQGLLGEIVHCHCAHSHDCLGHWFYGAAKAWAGKYLTTHNCDLYPTHDLGPVLSWMDIGCGDYFDYLTSTATDAFGPKDYFTRKYGPDHPLAKQKYTQGDIVSTVVRTKKGKTVVINYDMQLPRPYDNRWMIQGTRGIYNEQRNAVYIDSVSPGREAWEPFGPYHQAYRHKWWATPPSDGGHGGTDWLELKLFVDAVRNKTQTPLDVYDSVTMSCIFPLSGESIAKGSAPVKVPDFTRGKWETRKPYFAIDDRTFVRPGAPQVVRRDDGMLEQTLRLGADPPKLDLPGVAVRFTGDPKPHTRWPATGDQPYHCLFADSEWGIEVTVPKGSTGLVAVYAYDLEGVRKQTVTFQDREPTKLDDFSQGVWVEYAFTAEDSADGLLQLAVQKRGEGNCVLSKLKIAIAQGK